MELKEQKVICTKCDTRFEAKPKRSFLGFLKFICPKCKEKLIYPLTKGFTVLYWALAILLGLSFLGSLDNITRGEIVFPGGLGILAIGGIIALIKNKSIKKSVQEAQNRVEKSPN